MIGDAPAAADGRLRFQRPSDNFLPRLTVAEHLIRVARDGYVREVVEALGIADRLGHRPSQLSGGERQRRRSRRRS